MDIRHNDVNREKLHFHSSALLTKRVLLLAEMHEEVTKSFYIVYFLEGRHVMMNCKLS